MCQYKALKKIEKANGGVGRASLVRLQMYKDWGFKELNLTPWIYGPNSLLMG
jgi:hypothetical protein